MKMVIKSALGVIMLITIFATYAGPKWSKCIDDYDGNGTSDDIALYGAGEDDDEGYVDGTLVDILRKNRRLFQYVIEGDARGVKSALNVRADVNAKITCGDSILCYASNAKNVQITRLLLAHKADPNHRGHMGQTPLHYAVTDRSGLDSDAACIVLMLIAANARASLNSPDDVGQVPLAKARTALTIKALLLCGADYTIKNKKGLTPFEQSVSLFVRISPALSDAPYYPNHATCAQTLVAAGAINRRTLNELCYNKRFVALYASINCERNMCRRRAVHHPFVLHEYFYDMYCQTELIKEEFVCAQDWYAERDATLLMECMQETFLPVQIQHIILNYLYPPSDTILLDSLFIRAYSYLPERIADLIYGYAQPYVMLDIPNLQLHSPLYPIVREFVPWLIVQCIEENRCKRTERE